MADRESDSRVFSLSESLPMSTQKRSSSLAARFDRTKWAGFAPKLVDWSMSEINCELYFNKQCFRPSHGVVPSSGVSNSSGAHGELSEVKLEFSDATTGMIYVLVL